MNLSLPITLRPVEPEDAGRICLLAGDYEVSKMTSLIPHPYTMQHACDFIEMTSDDAYDVSAICLDNHFAGVVSADMQDPAHSGVRVVGYWLGRPYWGRGIMSKALLLKLENAFAKGAKTLRASVMHDNPASMRVLERCGFTRTGEAECPTLARRTCVPAVAFELTCRDWLKLKRSPVSD